EPSHESRKGMSPRCMLSRPHPGPLPKTSLQIAGQFGVFLLSVSAALAMDGTSVTTTVYVGRHVEVRNHDKPVKYVYQGENRVARISGSLTSTPRIQRLRLYQGWNLVSLAVESTNALEQLS